MQPLELRLHIGCKQNKRRKGKTFPPLRSRDYWTRTSDPYVPNVVRYQLR